MEKTRQLLDAAWQTWWDALTPVPFPLEYHNQGKSVPQSGTYGRLTLIPGDSESASIGSTHSRFPAILCLQIFVPEGAGFAIVTTAHDAVRAFWKNKQILDNTAGIQTNIDCMEVSLSQAGAENGYKQWNVWLNFRCDKFFPA